MPQTCSATDLSPGLRRGDGPIDVVTPAKAGGSSGFRATASDTGFRLRGNDGGGQAFASLGFASKAFSLAIRSCGDTASVSVTTGAFSSPSSAMNRDGSQVW